MNKMLKTAFIGAAIYIGSQLVFDFGKGHALGTLARSNIPATEAIDILASDKRLRLKFIVNVANLVKKRES